MPEYELPLGNSAKDFRKLSSFVQGYIEAMFFTDASSADDGELENASFADLADETISEIKRDCNDFQISLPVDTFGRTLLDLAYDYAPEAYDEERAGNDFWYSRNGHGTGFWDRGLGPVGKDLHKHAAKYGSCYLYMSVNKKIYIE